MLIESKDKYVSTLTSLWNKVFDDSEDYIKLFFKEAYSDSHCFGKIVDDEVVSAFYLLKCIIKYDGKIYKGRYLYAAATLPEYRGKGLMGELINEALRYAENEKLDFIALVPASDSLYDFYSRFGFKEAMHKYKYTVSDDTATLRAYREITDSDEFCRIRSSADIDMLCFNDIGNSYAFESLRYYGTRVFYLNDDAYYAENEELLCSDNETAANLIGNLCGESEVYTNCFLAGAEKVRNGMIYAVNDKVEFKDIYMNIALD